MPSRADIQPILDDIVAKLVRDYKPEAIILYGSFAYGTPTRHSDIDLFIVKETDKNRIDRYVEAAKLLIDLDVDIPVQPLVVTPSELEDRLAIGDPFFLEILNQGSRLYGTIRRPEEVTV